MNRLIRLLLLATLSCLAFSAQAGVKARLGKSRIALGQVVTLRIEYDGQTKNNPATRGLSRDFKVLSTKRKIAVDFKDGAIVARTVWKVRLKPKKAGRLTVPPIVIEGETTRPLKLRVVAPAKPKAPAKKTVTTPKPSPVQRQAAAASPVEPSPKPAAEKPPIPEPAEKPAPVVAPKPVAQVRRPEPPPVATPKLAPTKKSPPAARQAEPAPVIAPAPAAATTPLPEPRPVGPDEVFVETSVEPANPYVQQMVIFSVKIFHAIKLLDGELPDPVLQNALVRRLDIDRKDTVNRDGRRYKVIERRWAIFPQQAGPMTIEAPVLRARAPDEAAQDSAGAADQSIFDSDPYFAQTPFGKLLAANRSLELKGDSRRIEVRPPPPTGNVDGGWWMPAREVVLTERYDPPVDQLKPGDPVTRIVSLRVEGLTGAQLPRLPARRVAGARVYPDQVKPRTRENEHGVLGDIVQRFTYVPERAGDLAIPPIEVSWWDVLNDKPRVASIPGKMIHVAGVGGKAVSPDNAAGGVAHAKAGGASVAEKRVENRVAPKPDAKPQPQAGTASAAPRRATRRGGSDHAASSWLWRGLALAFALLWLATIGVFLRHHWRQRRDAREMVSGREPGHASIAREARREFERACRANAPRQARTALLRWASAHWPDNPPAGLTGLSRRFDNKAAVEAIAELNAHLFHNQRGQWRGQRLLEAVGKLPARPVTASREKGLPDLYQRAGE